jgi:hypothetical protein
MQRGRLYGHWDEVDTSVREPRGAPDNTRWVIASASIGGPFGAVASRAAESSGEPS